MAELILTLPASVQQRRPLCVLFLRHPGCPFAEKTVHLVKDAARRNPHQTFLFILHGDVEHAQKWLQKVGGDTIGDNLFWTFDEKRRLHRIWSVPETGIRHFLGPISIIAVIRLLSQGIHNRRASGSRFQAAATFWINSFNGVEKTHRPMHAGDLPTFDLPSCSE